MTADSSGSLEFGSRVLARKIEAVQASFKDPSALQRATSR
jgi:hypothetical protein